MDAALGLWEISDLREAIKEAGKIKQAAREKNEIFTRYKCKGKSRKLVVADYGDEIFIITGAEGKKQKTCPVCEKGILEPVDNIVSEIEGYFFIEKGKRCSHCGEEFIHEKDAQKTIEAARRLGVWPEPMKMFRTLSEVGRGLVFRIPADLERQLKLKAGEEVVVTKVGRKIIIEPAA